MVESLIIDNENNEILNTKDDSPKKILKDEMIAKISNYLKDNDWIRLAYLLGFLPHNIAYFVSKASSTNNKFSQCYLMLQTWRYHTPANQIVPRLFDSLVRMKQKFFAEKIKAEMTSKICFNQECKEKILEKKNQSKKKNNNHKTVIELFSRNTEVFSNENASMLARNFKSSEDWKRLAYALGLFESDVIKIIGKASSGRNSYSQANYMLTFWRNSENPENITKKLYDGLTRIKRYHLAHLVSIGWFTRDRNY